jgi:tRNA acetyltransferase TAN1
MNLFYRSTRSRDQVDYKYFIEIVRVLPIVVATYLHTAEMAPPPYKPNASSGGASHGGNRKRYLERSQKSRRIQRNPPRGAPGILMTCETSRERKCQNEGLDILRYYWDSQHAAKVAEGGVADADSESAAPVESEKLQTLEEEIEALKKANKKPAADDPFGVYETGCRGTVFVLCTLPGCPLIPPIQPTRIDGTKHIKKGAAGKDEGDGPSKKQKLDDVPKDEKDETVEETPVVNSSIANPVWDPLDSVRSIIGDLERSVSAPNTASQSGIPSSRYVTRMIPIQATCFASLEEIQQTVRALLDQVLAALPAKVKSTSTETSASTQTSFCVQVKRRNCGHVTRDQIIDTVGGVVEQATKEDPWKVNLRQPDYTVWIEICKTLTGVSIFPSSVQNMSRNFNLAEIREQVGVAAE